MPCTDLDKYDFVVRQGFDKSVKFRYIADGLPVDLTGSTILFNCEVDTFDQEATIVDPLTGEFTITFNATDTTNLPQRRVKYEVARVIDGTKTPLFVGSINLTTEGL